MPDDATHQSTDPRLPRLLAVMDETGWGGYVIRRRCHDYNRVAALGMLGIVSSAEAPGEGEEDWKLNLTRQGMALRRELRRLEALEDAA